MKSNKLRVTMIVNVRPGLDMEKEDCLRRS